MISGPVRLRVAFAAACVACVGASVQAGALDDLGRSIGNSASNALSKSLDSVFSGPNSSNQNQAGSQPASTTADRAAQAQNSQPANSKTPIARSGGNLGCGQVSPGGGQNNAFHNNCGFEVYLLLLASHGNGQCRNMGPISVGGSVPVPKTDPVRGVCVFRREVMGSHARGLAPCSCPA